MTGRAELAERPPRGSEGIKFLQRKAALSVGASEIRKFPGEFVNDFRIHWLVHTWPYFEVAGVNPNLPGIGWRNDNVPADELTPVHVVPKRGREQTDAIATLAEDTIGLLEHRHSGPLQIARIDRYVLLLGDHLQPVIETADHDGAHRSHTFDLLAFALPPPQAAFHGFRHRDALWQRKTNGRIDADAAGGGFLDRGNPGTRHRDLDAHV